MLNDIIFNNEKSAYYDWNITLTYAEIPLPQSKISTIDIKGSDGLLDLTSVTSTDVKYSNRLIKLNFELMDTNDYYTLISDIANYLHGEMISFKFTNDSNFYYRGRASINEWECSKQRGTIIITVDAEPYKIEVEDTVYSESINNETKYITLSNLRKKVVPTIELTNGNITLTFNEKDYVLQSGTQTISTLVLNKGDNIIKINGNGTVRFTYRRMSL